MSSVSSLEFSESSSGLPILCFQHPPLSGRETLHLQGLQFHEDDLRNFSEVSLSSLSGNALLWGTMFSNSNVQSSNVQTSNVKLFHYHIGFWIHNDDEDKITSIKSNSKICVSVSQFHSFFTTNLDYALDLWSFGSLYLFTVLFCWLLSHSGLPAQWCWPFSWPPFWNLITHQAPKKSRKTNWHHLSRLWNAKRSFTKAEKSRERNWIDHKTWFFCGVM